MAVVQASGLIGGNGSPFAAPTRLLGSFVATGVVSAAPTTAAGNIITTLRLIVPLIAVPSQILAIELNGQVVNLNVYQRTTGLFVDVGLNNLLVIGGVIAHDRVLIVRDPYLGFVGDLAFWDSQGLQDPEWTGLNSRFYLGYFDPTTTF